MMKLRLFALSAALVASLGTIANAAEYLMIPDSSSTTGRRIMLFSPVDGSLVNPAYINLNALTGASTPKHALQVKGEIWVSDQVADRVDIFTLGGTYLRTISGGLDNIRGMGFANNTVYVTNDGAANGAVADTVVMYDTAGTFLGRFPVSPATSPFGVYDHNGELLVTDSTEHTIRRYSYAGASLGVFHSGAIRFPEQIHKRVTNDNLIVTGFSPPSGVYELTPAGAQVNFFFSGSGARGAYELTNGNFIYTIGTGAYVGPYGGTHPGTLVHGANAQFVDKLVIPEISGRVILSDFVGDVSLQTATLTFSPTDNSGDYVKVVTLGPSGEYSFNADMGPGSYSVKAKSSHWLAKSAGVVAIGSVNTGLSFVLTNGDCDDDNEVGIGDYSILSAAYNTSLGDPGFVPAADLNGDDSVDIGDYAILSANYGLSGD